MHTLPARCALRPCLWAQAALAVRAGAPLGLPASRSCEVWWEQASG
jgi:hypothetical protein